MLKKTPPAPTEQSILSAFTLMFSLYIEYMSYVTFREPVVIMLVLNSDSRWAQKIDHLTSAEWSEMCCKNVKYSPSSLKVSLKHVYEKKKRNNTAGWRLQLKDVSS